jgi:hypothetical protein
MRRIHRRRLAPIERLRLRWLMVDRALGGIGGRIRHGVIGPAIKAAGDLLDYVPERIRPKIRTRDRRAR